MKRYTISMTLVTYYKVTVEAEDQDEAYEMAEQEAFENNTYDDIDHWQVDSEEELNDDSDEEDEEP